MKTSWDEQEWIDAFLDDRLSELDQQAFSKRLKSDPHFARQIQLQKKALTLIQKFGRAELKTQLQQVHDQLFTDVRHISFRQRVLSFFTQ